MAQSWFQKSTIIKTFRRFPQVFNTRWRTNALLSIISVIVLKSFKHISCPRDFWLALVLRRQEWQAVTCWFWLVPSLIMEYRHLWN